MSHLRKKSKIINQYLTKSKRLCQFCSISIQGPRTRRQGREIKKSVGQRERKNKSRQRYVRAGETVRAERKERKKGRRFYKYIMWTGARGVRGMIVGRGFHGLCCTASVSGARPSAFGEKHPP